MGLRHRNLRKIIDSCDSGKVDRQVESTYAEVRTRRIQICKSDCSRVDSYSAFRSWFLTKTPFREFADTAQPLSEEQKAARSRAAENWWRSYWIRRSSCVCGVCGE